MRRPTAKVANLPRPCIARWPLTMLLIVLCYLLSQPIHAAASLAVNSFRLSVPGYANQLNDLGYQHAWVERLNQMAKRALEEDEPYLASRLWTAMAELR